MRRINGRGAGLVIARGYFEAGAKVYISSWGVALEDYTVDGGYCLKWSINKSWPGQPFLLPYASVVPSRRTPASSVS